MGRQALGRAVKPISFQLEFNEYEKYFALANEMGQSFSDWIRSAMKCYAEMNGQIAAPPTRPDHIRLNLSGEYDEPKSPITTQVPTKEIVETIEQTEGQRLRELLEGRKGGTY